MSADPQNGGGSLSVNKPVCRRCGRPIRQQSGAWAHVEVVPGGLRFWCGPEEVWPRVDA